MGNEQLLQDMVSRLRRALGDDLVGVVLYGPRARGETVRDVGHLNLLIVASDLDPGTLEALGPPVRWWLGKDQPWPRLFSRELIRDSLDVYPVEFLDISRHHQVLHGEDPFLDVELDTSHLRLQCERDLREKLMRLREGYVECGGATRPLRRLLAASHTSFVPLWRACLHLLGCEAPAHDSEVISCLCERLELDGGALEEVGLLATGARTKEPAALFARYLHELSETVARVDRLVVQQEGYSP